MTSNIRLTSVDNDAQMDLTRLYFLVIDTCIMYIYPLTSVKHILSTFRSRKSLFVVYKD